MKDKLLGLLISLMFREIGFDFAGAGIVFLPERNGYRNLTGAGWENWTEDVNFTVAFLYVFSFTGYLSVKSADWDWLYSAQSTVQWQCAGCEMTESSKKSDENPSSNQ